MATIEGEATKQVRLGASECGARLLRNNTGAFKDENGRWVRFGLGTETKLLREEYKFSDLVGVTPVEITQEMVGKTVGVITMIEVKPEGKLPAVIKRAENVPKSREAGQLRAIQFIRNLGGIAWFASTADDMKVIYHHYLKELKK